jgi:hypothetical protein
MHEWHDRQRHAHILVRTSAALTRDAVRALFEKTLPHVRFSCHCDRVRSPAAIAHYICKNLRDQSKAEPPPADFRGKVYSCSRGFLTSSVSALWAEQVRAWYPPSES